MAYFMALVNKQLNIPCPYIWFKMTETSSWVESSCWCSRHVKKPHELQKQGGQSVGVTDLQSYVLTCVTFKLPSFAEGKGQRRHMGVCKEQRGRKTLVTPLPQTVTRLNSTVWREGEPKNSTQTVCSFPSLSQLPLLQFIPKKETTILKPQNSDVTFTGFHPRNGLN